MRKTRTATKTLSFTCPACGAWETWDAKHMTLSLVYGEITLRAKCAVEGVTVDTPICPNLLPLMLSTPLLLDPDVRDHLQKQGNR